MNKIPNTYDLGLRGMELNRSGNGKYIEASVYKNEMAECDRMSDNNRELAENLLIQQDDEIASKNKEILELKDNLKESVIIIKGLTINSGETIKVTDGKGLPVIVNWHEDIQ